MMTRHDITLAASLILPQILMMPNRLPAQASPAVITIDEEVSDPAMFAGWHHKGILTLNGEKYESVFPPLTDAKGKPVDPVSIGWVTLKRSGSDITLTRDDTEGTEGHADYIGTMKSETHAEGKVTWKNPSGTFQGTFKADFSGAIASIARPSPAPQVAATSPTSAAPQTKPAQQMIPAGSYIDRPGGPLLPASFDVCQSNGKGLLCGKWVWDGNRYIATWDNYPPMDMVIQRRDGDDILFTSGFMSSDPKGALVSAFEGKLTAAGLEGGASYHYLDGKPLMQGKWAPVNAKKEPVVAVADPAHPAMREVGLGDIFDLFFADDRTPDQVFADNQKARAREAAQAEEDRQRAIRSYQAAHPH